MPWSQIADLTGPPGLDAPGIGGVLDCSGMLLASEVNAATAAAPAGTTVWLGPRPSGAELQVDETLIIRPSTVLLGAGGRTQATRLKVTAGFPAGAPVVAAQGYLTNAALCDSPVLVRGIAIYCGSKAGSHGLVVYHYWSTFDDIQIFDCAGNGTVSDTAAILLGNRGIDGVSVTGNSHSENVLRLIRIDGLTNGASGIVQTSYSSAGNGGSANQDGHLLGLFLSGGSAGTGGHGMHFDRAAGWTMADVHMYGPAQYGARLYACYATDLTGWYIENFGRLNVASANYSGLQMELLRGRGSTLSNVKISSGQPDSPAAARFSNFHIRASNAQVAMVSLVGCGSYLNMTAAPASRRTQAWRFGESGDTGTLHMSMAGCVTDPLDGWMSPQRYVRTASVVLTEQPGTLRSQPFSATPTIDPQLVGDRVKMVATANVTALGVSTTNAADRQVLQLIVPASGGTRTVTFAAAIRTTTGLTRGPYTVPAGELLRAAVEYSADAAAWYLTAATVTAA